MDFVDSKYISLISTRLSKFKKVKTNLYNFRCPICGDSQKNKNKARGYLYQVKNNTNFKCHNCGVNISFNNFLKQIDSVVYKQYSLEKFKEGKTGKNFTVEEPVFHFDVPKFEAKLDLPKASENSNAKSYLESRKLNPHKFYYTDQFKSWTNSLKDVFDADAFKKAAETPKFKQFIADKGNLMMNISGDEADTFLTRYQSVTTWLLYDAGATKVSPADLGIPKP